MLLGLLGAFGAAVLYGAGTVLQAAGVRGSAGRPAGAPGSTGLRSAGLYGAGLLLDALGFLASLAALRTLPLFVVQSAIASSVAVTAVLAAVFLGSRLERSDIVVENLPHATFNGQDAQLDAAIEYLKKKIAEDPRPVPAPPPYPRKAKNSP